MTINFLEVNGRGLKCERESQVNGPGLGLGIVIDLEKWRATLPCNMDAIAEVDGKRPAVRACRLSAGRV